MADALEAEIKQLYDDWIANPSAVVCARLADRLRLAGRIGEALDVVSRGLEEWPASAQINLACARCRRESGEIALALESFQKVLSADPLNLVALRAVGEIAFEQQRYEDAERLLGDYLFENPADPEAEKLLGRVREMRSAPLTPSAPPVREPARAAEASTSETMPSAPRREEVPESGPAGPAPVSAPAEREPVPAAEPVPEAPPDLAPFTPLIAVDEPVEHAAGKQESIQTLSVGAGSSPAGVSATGGSGPVGMPASEDTPARPEPSTPAVHSTDSQPPAGYDWIRSAAGLFSVDAGSAEPEPPAAADEAIPETTAPPRDVFPRTDRMERIIEAQTVQQTAPAEPSAGAVSAPGSGAPVEEPPAPPPAPPNHQAQPRTPAQAQRQAMPRREPRSLLDLFSLEEREELGLEPFRQEEQ